MHCLQCFEGVRTLQHPRGSMPAWPYHGKIIPTPLGLGSRGGILSRFKMPNSAVPRNLRKLSYNYMGILSGRISITPLLGSVNTTISSTFPGSAVFSLYSYTAWYLLYWRQRAITSLNRSSIRSSAISWIPLQALGRRSGW